MPVISSLSVSLLCVCLHCTVSSAYTSVHNLATHMCHLPYNCHLHSQWTRLRHTSVACHIHVSFALALTETRRPGILFYFTEPNARRDLRKRLVWRGVHFEQLSQHVLLFGNRWLVHDCKKLVLPLDDGMLLLVRLG